MRNKPSPSRRIKSRNGKVYNFISSTALCNAVYRQYYYKARDRAIKWDLSMQQFIEITAMSCYYCGAPPSNTHSRNSDDDRFIYNGIDRIDNNAGYTLTNSAPCCKTCNIMKGARHIDEFIIRCVRIAERHR